MIRLILIVALLFIVFYIIYKISPKLKVFLLKLIKSPFVFIILKNLIRVLLKKF